MPQRKKSIFMYELSKAGERVNQTNKYKNKGWLSKRSRTPAITQWGLVNVAIYTASLCILLLQYHCKQNIIRRRFLKSI